MNILKGLTQRIVHTGNKIHKSNSKTKMLKPIIKFYLDTWIDYSGKLH